MKESGLIIFEKKTPLNNGAVIIIELWSKVKPEPMARQSSLAHWARQILQHL